MKKIITAVDRLSGLGGWFSAAMICLALVIVIAEILLRSILSRTLYVAEEYSGYLMCMLTFCALGYTLRERSHIRMVFLHRLLAANRKIVLDIICNLVGLIFCIGLTYFSAFFFWDSLVNQSQSMQISETYLAIPEAFMPLGALILALQFLGETLKSILLLRGDTEGIRIAEEAEDLGR